MIIYQQWTRDKKVAVFAVQRCTNGMSGWDARICFYDPAKGETAQTVPWEFLGAAHDLVSVLRYPVLSKMAEIIDSPQEVGSISNLLESLHKIVQGIATHLEKIA